MLNLKPNKATTAELINLHLPIPRSCSGCGVSISEIPHALLCHVGHIWYNCSVCLSTNILVNRVLLTPEQLLALDRAKADSRYP